MKMKLSQFSLLSALTVLLATMMAPASADEPVDFPFPPAVFDDSDPCTGEIQTITIFFDVLLHVHKNNFVARVIRTGFTTAGFEMFNGTQLQTQNSNSNIFKDSFVDMWRRDDGLMFQARGNFVLDLDTFEVKVDNFRLKCLGG